MKTQKEITEEAKNLAHDRLKEAIIEYIECHSECSVVDVNSKMYLFQLIEHLKMVYNTRRAYLRRQLMCNLGFVRVTKNNRVTLEVLEHPDDEFPQITTDKE